MHEAEPNQRLERVRAVLDQAYHDAMARMGMGEARAEELDAEASAAARETKPTRRLVWAFQKQTLAKGSASGPEGGIVR
ncbi:hypothetical protein C7445_103209 [Alicyclobacillus sacchari]|uniref:Uncharacterized protein n=1 Tax=Alicyclobacillus sacchari TaxID=392010 RepID=A0A4R8LRD9_9BACL|nr:hypothetical protein [Alicyclobacillus sacchari]TDY50163.1 hypothetical protein C7445_103209 [Alicyclobacillus sacchari]GMA57462.1 hypothetical protein GCM10025858_19650 [Alicyclobacillus sacchari]